MKLNSNDVFVKFIVKQAVVTSAITFLIAGQTQKLASLIVDTLVEPLFSIDLDKDGNPDLKQMEKKVIEKAQSESQAKIKAAQAEADKAKKIQKSSVQILTNFHQ